MNSIMCVAADTDQKIRIEQILADIQDVSPIDGIHVVYIYPSMDLKAFEAQITAKVPHNNVIAHTSPLKRMIELLIQISIKSNCLLTDSSIQFQIAKSVKKIIQLNQLRVGFNSRCILHLYTHYKS